jgi:signal transduction histidine kinase/CheY-like chemotaxis protein
MIQRTRVLLLALRGRDAAVIQQILERQEIDCCECRSVAQLAARLDEEAGLAIVTEESLDDVGNSQLPQWLANQPPWSDFPFILLATRRVGKRPKAAAAALEMLGNVIVLERPIHTETLLRAVESARRGRHRQWEARRRLAELKSAEEMLTEMNNSLEQSIAERTIELSQANDRLTQEIAERERAQTALVQSQKMEAVGQLTGGIAHDFNNLLTVIAGNLDMIQRRAMDAKIGTQAGHALQAAERAAKLTQQLLVFSRSQKLMLEPVDLNGLLKGMNDLLERTIGADASVDIVLGESEPWAMADKNQLELAILNLAINARDAMPDGGGIVIRTAIEDADPAAAAGTRFGVISVRDNGPGIPAHLIQRVFDPFFTTKPVGKGTGLGLSQVYGIAKQSGGTVRLDSQIGKGTNVSICLPLAPATQEGDEREVSTEISSGKRDHSVLVVEDDAAVREFIVECLQTSGCKVSQAANGHEALQSLRHSVPDLLIVDFAMPGMNGAELVQMVWAEHPQLPVLLATGYADMNTVEKVIPIDRVLRKPFRSEELLRAIDTALTDAA